MLARYIRSTGALVSDVSVQAKRFKSDYGIKQKRSRFVFHQAFQPAANAMVDMDSLGLTYPCTVIPATLIKSNMWTSPPVDGAVPEGIPFAVTRTLLGQSLPVYTEYKGGRTKVITVVRRVRGDIDAMTEELSKVCDGAEITLGLGKIFIKGNYHGRVKMWLTGLGF